VVHHLALCAARRDDPVDVVLLGRRGRGRWYLAEGEAEPDDREERATKPQHASGLRSGGVGGDSDFTVESA